MATRFPADRGSRWEGCPGQEGRANGTGKRNRRLATACSSVGLAHRALAASRLRVGEGVYFRASWCFLRVMPQVVAKQVFPTRIRTCISRLWCGVGLPRESCAIGADRSAVFRSVAARFSLHGGVHRSGSSVFRTPGGHPESPDDSGWPPPAGRWLRGCRTTRRKCTCRRRQAVGKTLESGAGWIRWPGACLFCKRHTKAEKRRADVVREESRIRRVSTSPSPAQVTGICSSGSTFTLSDMAPGCLSENRPKTSASSGLLHGL